MWKERHSTGPTAESRCVLVASSKKKKFQSPAFWKGVGMGMGMQNSMTDRVNCEITNNYVEAFTPICVIYKTGQLVDAERMRPSI